MSAAPDGATRPNTAPARLSSGSSTSRRRGTSRSTSRGGGSGANMQYFEGGSLIPNSPGRLTFSDVTLERGATQDRDGLTLRRWSLSARGP